jgi:signal transduction histidine kinase
MLEFLLASLAGLGLVVIVASWLQNRSSRRVHALAQALDAARRGEVVTAAPARQDDFAPVLEAAERMGQALQEERAHAAEIRERDLAVLSQAMDGGLILLRPDGSLDFVSPRCERFFGCADREELESELTRLGGRLQPALQSVKRGRLAQGSTVDVQLERDGIRRDLRLELYALGAEAREGFLVRVRDLEAVRMVETNLGLAKHLRHLSRVYVATTHEIRAPLHAMALNLELLGIAAAEGDDPALRARQQNYVKIIGDEFKRLSRLLESLLSQARLHGDAVEPFDLTRAVQEMMTLLEPFCRGQHVRVFLAVPEAPVMVLANSDATKQSVLNIVMNALDAMGKGGELRVTLRRDSAGAHLAIADTGPGIAPEIMDHLFQMHATTKQRGTGVGLYVARNVVESFGGSIAVESKPNEGACFEIQLPLAPGEA